MDREQPLALKEWAVTVNALLSGELICVMRKGGIHEETKKFEVKSSQFLLMPAYEHQKEQLLKPAYQGRIMDTIKLFEQNPNVMTINGYAELVEDIELYDEAAVASLFHEHIWTEQFATERFKWKKTHPLHLLILRTYQFAEPIELQMQPTYIGCKSWITVEEQVKLGHATPVLNDEQFNEKREAIKRALNLV